MYVWTVELVPEQHYYTKQIVPRISTGANDGTDGFPSTGSHRNSLRLPNLGRWLTKNVILML